VIETSVAIWGEATFDDALSQLDPTTAQTVRLSAELCAVPGVTVPAAATDFEAVSRTARIAADWAREAGLKVLFIEPTDDAPYPFVVVGFAEHDLEAPYFREVVALIGHLDVVPPREEGQFVPRIEGGDLYARGAADMKTVAATFLTWMARRQAGEGPRPPVLALLSCCEENGSAAPHNADSVIRWLRTTYGVKVRFAIVGERTGELEWMKPEPVVGPICKENRSWRWVRISSEAASGLSALKILASTVGRGRREVVRLNADEVPVAKAARQPGLRSGFVNPFVQVAGDAIQSGPAVWLSVERPAGAAIHSAAAKADAPSLIEVLAEVADAALERWDGAVTLSGVEIGQDGNFNSYDGSGAMTLRLDRVDAGEVRAWATRALATTGLIWSASTRLLPTTPGPTVVGLDIRELLDHRVAVRGLLARFERGLWGDGKLEQVSARPPWRCPSGHPDLVRLESAWEAVVGEPSPNLVKLHGNDGGSLVEIQQARSPALAAVGEGHAVVFGQVGMRPHGRGEFHRLSSVDVYLQILDRWADLY
jgi:hypothetical protein